ncbi:MAG: glycoside hydrolase family 32 protein [Planctomycetia bacterium]|nr:glycoside hydrolase family 32 protein [Planctomycetia bacterium]
MLRFAFPLLLLAASPFAAADRADILVADFEGDAYAEGWKSTGSAFGKGPARGTLPNQMPVSGYLGKGLVNSYLDGDGSTGTLTSSEFKIERKYINFLVGGGKHAKTCINLLVDGKVVRTATGPNDKPGGSEHLDWHTWDVSAFAGKPATIQIVDEEKGGWGHINVDHIVMSDKKKQAERMTRPIVAEKKYLHLPVKNGAAKRHMTISVRHDVRPFREQVRDVVVREFDIELADGVEPDFWVFVDVSAFKGKTLIVKTMLPADSKALASLKLADDVPDAEKVYREKHRPLFHFTSRVGWLNDPNGLVYHDGEWHLFYQHNPYGREWGNMHWGHATSKDLFRWKEHDIGLYPKKYGDWAFSGSAVVDKENTSGWGTKEKPPLVLAYTSTGRGECIAFSTDNGRSWKEYDKNPVVKHTGRDPKLIWHEKAKHWVMAVYTEADKKQWIAFYTSPDLKEWKFASRIEGFFECPDLFELPVNEKQDETKWVLYAADGKYLVGEFDGKEFKPDFKEKKQLWHGRFYAAQTFDNTPQWKPEGWNGPHPPAKRVRRVQIGWAQGITFPGMPFNQQMTVPVELQLLLTPNGPALHAHPVTELKSLREEKPVIDIKKLPAVTWGVDPATGMMRETLANDLDAFDLYALLSFKGAKTVGLDLRGTKLTYDVAKETLTVGNVTAPLKLRRPTLELRILMDRGSVEVFADGGRVAFSVAAVPDEKNRKLEVFSTGGDVSTRRFELYKMKSAWEK